MGRKFKGSKTRLTQGPPLERANKEYALEHGLPLKITGNPLGCGCSEAFLISAGEAKDQKIEADYQCDSGWHNYVVFDVMPREDKIEITKTGQIVMGGEGHQAGPLQEL